MLSCGTKGEPVKEECGVEMIAALIDKDSQLGRTFKPDALFSRGRQPGFCYDVIVCSCFAIEFLPESDRAGRGPNGRQRIGGAGLDCRAA